MLEEEVCGALEADKHREGGAEEGGAGGTL